MDDIAYTVTLSRKDIAVIGAHVYRMVQAIESGQPIPPEVVVSAVAALDSLLGRAELVNKDRP